MASVTFDGVSKRYGEVTAVDHLDLAINDGEFMVRAGWSGPSTRYFRTSSGDSMLRCTVMCG